MTHPWFRQRYVWISLLVAAAMAAEASAGSLLVLDYNGAKAFGSVHIAGGAIDLTNGAMIVTTSSFGFVPSGAPGYGHEYGVPGVAEFGDAAIHDAILEGLNAVNGYWDGTNGIMSSTAANQTNTGIGWIDNGALGDDISFFRGVAVPPNSSIIAYTYYGDTDLSGKVDISDYEQTVNNYHRSTNGGYLPSGYVDWFDGDTDYSGVIDISDYENTVNNYPLPALYAGYESAATGANGSSAAAQDLSVGEDSGAFAPAQAQYVPEPSAFCLLAVAAACGFGLRSLRTHRS